MKKEYILAFLILLLPLLLGGYLLYCRSAGKNLFPTKEERLAELRKLEKEMKKYSFQHLPEDLTSFQTLLNRYEDLLERSYDRIQEMERFDRLYVLRGRLYRRTQQYDSALQNTKNFLRDLKIRNKTDSYAEIIGRMVMAEMVEICAYKKDLKEMEYWTDRIFRNFPALCRKYGGREAGTKELKADFRQFLYNVYYSLAESFLAAGKGEKSRSLLEEYIAYYGSLEDFERSPENDGTFFRIGCRVYESLGNREQACFYAEKNIAIGRKEKIYSLDCWKLLCKQKWMQKNYRGCLSLVLELINTPSVQYIPRDPDDKIRWEIVLAGMESALCLKDYETAEKLSSCAFPGKVTDPSIQEKWKRFSRLIPENVRMKK